MTVTKEEHAMTGLEFVRHVFGPCTIDEGEALLWECTAYPCCDVAHIKKQLLYIKEKSGGNVGKALAIADAETKAAMKDLPEEPTP